MKDSGPDVKKISIRLLSYLGTELAAPDISYSGPLTRILGGYDAFTYQFCLEGAGEELSKPLILRLYAEERNPETVIRETAVQNALSAQGYPAPAVFFTSTDTKILGGVFMIMAHMDGEMMMEVEREELPRMLGEAHATLHRIDTKNLIQTLADQGIPAAQFSLNTQLISLDSQRLALPWMDESIQWLIDNQPPKPKRLSICHGDFHPMNILVTKGKVTAVLDWPGFMIDDAAIDVAATMILVQVVANHLMPEADLGEIMSQYLESYKDIRTLEERYLDYYRMLRCVPAIIEGAAGRGAWSIEPIFKGLIDTVFEISKIEVVPR